MRAVPTKSFSEALHAITLDHCFGRHVLVYVVFERGARISVLTSNGTSLSEVFEHKQLTLCLKKISPLNITTRIWILNRALRSNTGTASKDVVRVFSKTLQRSGYTAKLFSLYKDMATRDLFRRGARMHKVIRSGYPQFLFKVQWTEIVSFSMDFTDCLTIILQHSRDFYLTDV